MNEPRYVDRWLAAVMASTTLKDRAKVTAYGLSRFADWDNGRDCYPSCTALALACGDAVRTVTRGRAELEAAGLIARTGIGRPKNTTDYALILPASSANSGRTGSANSGATEPASSANSGATGNGQFGHLRQSVRPPEAISSATVGRQPHQTSSRPLGSDEDEEERTAPPPEGGALRETQTALSAMLAARWQTRTPPMSNQIRAQLADLLNAGWTPAQIIAGAATISPTPKNPAGLLGVHLGRLLTDHQPADFDPSAPAADPVPAPNPHPDHGQAKPATPTPAPVDQALAAHLDPYAGQAVCPHGIPTRTPHWCHDCRQEQEHSA